MTSDFTLDDFRKQFQDIQKMGLKNTIAQMPGMSETVQDGEDPDVALLACPAHDRCDDARGTSQPEHDR